MNFSPWSLTLKVIAGSFHSVAVAGTHGPFWWDDGWAAFALVVDVLCLTGTLLEGLLALGRGDASIDKITNCIGALGFPLVLWGCRISILLSIIRITFLLGVGFLTMWAVLMGQKVQICVSKQCEIAGSVGISQLISQFCVPPKYLVTFTLTSFFFGSHLLSADVLSDTVLVGLPVYLLRRTRISQRQQTMLFSIFSASMLITPVTVLHSVILLTVQSSGIIVIDHVKASPLSLIVRNLLVIVTFVYRVCRRGKADDLDATEEVLCSLTSVDSDVDFTFSTTAESAVDSGMVTMATTTTRTTASESCIVRMTESPKVQEKAGAEAPGSGSGSGRVNVAFGGRVHDDPDIEDSRHPRFKLRTSSDVAFYQITDAWQRLKRRPTRYTPSLEFLAG
ncbi:hypothetical protein JVU11DRAFT_7953 [Chiua virens]|nr:hypothetical protein JVU11DRAFT_7953 [Chiua virens]